MKKGFTLIELIIVAIIIAVLATLGLTQYGRMIERSRGAEAREVLGGMRKYAAAYWMQNGAFALSPNLNPSLGLGGSPDQVPELPGNCRQTHYFQYAYSWTTADTINFTAQRCTSLGKNPQGTLPAGLLVLSSVITTGTDTWTSAAGY